MPCGRSQEKKVELARIKLTRSKITNNDFYMRQEDLREYLEEVVDNPEKIDEIMRAIGTPQKEESTVEKQSDSDIDLLILNEPDWRKKAQLAALKISRGFDL